jgi:hypothetical protein
MTNFNSPLNKSFLYNLILFDFLFLINHTKKSVMIFKKYKEIKNTALVRLDVFELLKSFKRFVRSFYFLNKGLNKKMLVHICTDNLQHIKFLNILFKKYNLNILLNVTHLLPRLNFNFFDLKSVLVLEKFLSYNNFKSLSFNHFFLVHEINTFTNDTNYGSFKIYNNFSDFKKLLFIGILLLQILKK